MAGCPWVCLPVRILGEKRCAWMTFRDPRTGVWGRQSQVALLSSIEQMSVDCQGGDGVWGAWLAVFPLGGWFIHTMKEDEGTGPAEVGKLGGEDFDPVVVGQVVNGAEVGVE